MCCSVRTPNIDYSWEWKKSGKSCFDVCITNKNYDYDLYGKTLFFTCHSELFIMQVGSDECATFLCDILIRLYFSLYHTAHAVSQFFRNVTNESFIVIRPQTQIQSHIYVRSSNRNGIRLLLLFRYNLYCSSSSACFQWKLWIFLPYSCRWSFYFDFLSKTHRIVNGWEFCREKCI